jgi:hypothetical protein
MCLQRTMCPRERSADRPRDRPSQPAKPSWQLRRAPFGKLRGIDGCIIAPRRTNSAHLHRPWRATARFCTMIYDLVVVRRAHVKSRRVPPAAVASRSEHKPRPEAPRCLGNETRLPTRAPGSDEDFAWTPLRRRDRRRRSFTRTNPAGRGEPAFDFWRNRSF